MRNSVWVTQRDIRLATRLAELIKTLILVNFQLIQFTIKLNEIELSGLSLKNSMEVTALNRKLI